MDPAVPDRDLPEREVSGDETAAPEGSAMSSQEMQNRGSPAMPSMMLDEIAEIFGDLDERLRPTRAKSPQRQSGGGVPGDAPPVTKEAEVETARRHAELLSAQAHAAAEELLSRARSHADLVRAHADAARAEAECLRAEAAALRGAVQDEAEAATSRAESLMAQARAVAEELRAAMEGEADAARAEVERLRTEAASLRRLLQAEIDAGLAEAQRMRAEAQRLWAETKAIAAELGLQSARAGAAAPLEAGGLGTTTGAKRADHPGDFPPAGAAADEDPGPGGPTAPDGAAEAPPAHHEAERHEDGPRGWQPLIGSGGWHAGTAGAPDAAPGGEPAGNEAMPPPDRGRRSLRRRRR